MLTNIDNTGTPYYNLSVPPQIYELVAPLVRPSWLSDQQIEGQLVRLYRDYVEGRQRSFLTAKQRKMLNIKTSAIEQIFINYCSMVVEVMAERLNVTTIEGDKEEQSAWSESVLAFNRFDGQQMDVTEASLRDGASYVMVAYDNEAQMPTLAFEPAWDGYLGVIPIYDRMLRKVIAAIKVWYENSNFRRFNIYWPDRVEKYIEMNAAAAGGDVAPGISAAAATGELGDKALQIAPYRNRAGAYVEPWLDRDGTPLGVPLVPFRNRWKNHRTTGISELAPVISLQDSLNRTLIDTLMTSGLTAFPLKVALGFKPPASVAAGDWIVIGEEGLSKEQQYDAKVLPQGEIVPFISQMSFLIDQIATISRTPLPDFMGADSASGEALKQREVGLLSKVERYKVKAGDNWGDVMALAARVQDAYGTKRSPDGARDGSVWHTRWADSETRNDPQTIANALAVRDAVGEQEFLRLIAPVFGYDDTKIAALLAEKQTAKASALAGLILPGFNDFTPPQMTAGGQVAQQHSNGNGTMMNRQEMS